MKNNMITEDYVSFETAKLLKEKGFECEKDSITAMYNEIGKFHPLSTAVAEYYYDYNDFDEYDYVAPTLQMAMKWLRKMHGLFIRITEDMTGNVFEWSVYQKNYGCKASTYVEDSYEKACETAIKYCLEILI